MASHFQAFVYKISSFSNGVPPNKHSAQNLWSKKGRLPWLHTETTRCGARRAGYTQRQPVVEQEGLVTHRDNPVSLQNFVFHGFEVGPIVRSRRKLLFVT